VSIDDDTWIDRGVVLLAAPARGGRETRWLPNEDFAGEPGELRIGKRCHIGPYSILSGKGGLFVGDDVTISAGGRVYSLSHHYRSYARPWDTSVGFGSQVPDDRQVLLAGPITIGTNAGLGADVLVLPGVRIGRGGFIAPRSVVRSSIPDYSLAGGDPAEVRGPRFAEPPDAAS
jgi:acetyltransferase-like isoleucine patch superfamily enzyme